MSNWFDPKAWQGSSWGQGSWGQDAWTPNDPDREPDEDAPADPDPDDDSPTDDAGDDASDDRPGEGPSERSGGDESEDRPSKDDDSRTHESEGDTTASQSADAAEAATEQVRAANPRTTPDVGTDVETDGQDGSDDDPGDADASIPTQTGDEDAPVRPSRSPDPRWATRAGLGNDAGTAPRGITAELTRLAVGRTVTAQFAGRTAAGTITTVELVPTRRGSGMPGMMTGMMTGLASGLTSGLTSGAMQEMMTGGMTPAMFGASQWGADRTRGDRTSTDDSPELAAGGGHADTVLDDAHVTFGDVTWGDWLLTTVRVRATPVHLEPPPTAALTTGPLAVAATVAVGTVADWLDDIVADLTVDDLVADPPDTLVLTGRWRRLRFVAHVVPRVTSSSVVLGLRGAHLLDRRLPLPRRFRPAVDIPLGLAADLRLDDVVIGDDDVTVHLRHAGVRWPVDLRRLLDRLRQDDRPIGLDE